MSLPDIILASVLFLLLVGFAVVVWKAASNWRWFNIVAVVFTMLLSIAFLFPTAVVLKSRSAWHKVQEDLEKRVVELRARTQEIERGVAVGADSEPSGGLLELQSELAGLALEAGRRWRNLQYKSSNLNGNPKTILLGPPPVDNLAGQPGEPPENANAESLVPDQTLVYGFAETPNDDQINVPTFYLGEFIVQASNADEATLIPAGKLDAEQIAYIEQGAASSWLLCELLPPDGHRPFLASDVPETGNCLGSVDKELVESLLPNAPESTKLAYLEDGRAKKTDDPPETHWVQLEFTKTHKIQVDSPDQQRALEDGGFFDGNGRALDAALQYAENDGYITFSKDSEPVLMKKEGADELLELGVAKKLGDYYLRPLNDYGFLFRRIRLNLVTLADKKVELTAEKAVLTEMFEKTQKMLVNNQDVKNKLEQDLKQFELEHNSIREYSEKLAVQAEAMYAEMNRLEQENAELEQQIEQKHLKIERELDALTGTP